MAEQHPAEDALLDLALGEVSEPESERLALHLSACTECRGRYDAVIGTIDQTLAATPRIQAPPGFDQAVLETIGLAPPRPSSTVQPLERHAQRRPWHRRPVLLAAAAVVVGVVLGVAGSWTAGVLDDDTPSESVQAIAGSPLLTSDGDTVGSASTSYLDGRSVIVVTATGGNPGTTYECRLRLADGDVMTVGEWPAPGDAGATWVVPAPATPAVGVELVAESGTIWSSADL